MKNLIDFAKKDNYLGESTDEWLGRETERNVVTEIDLTEENLRDKSPSYSNWSSSKLHSNEIWFDTSKFTHLGSYKDQSDESSTKVSKERRVTMDPKQAMKTKIKNPKQLPKTTRASSRIVINLAIFNKYQNTDQVESIIKSSISKDKIENQTIIP